MKRREFLKTSSVVLGGTFTLVLFLALVACSVPLTTAIAEEWNAKLNLSFASDPAAARASFEIERKFDLSAVDEVHVTFSIDRPEAACWVTLYFQSGDGWYCWTADVRQSGRQTHVFLLPAHRKEGQPGSLDQINHLRLSFWRGRAIDATVELHELKLISYPVVVLEPKNARSEPVVRTWNRQLRTLLTDCGVEVGGLEQTALTASALKDRRVVILPLNSGLTEEHVTLLKRFVESGGKLIAFHLLPDELMRTLGFTPGSDVGPQEEVTTLAEVRFEPWFAEEFTEGIPMAFGQRSGIIRTAQPLDSSDRFHARTAAVWFDDSGKPTDHAALLVSDRGAFFSHILTEGEGDTDRRQDFMLSLLAKYYPDLWDDIKNKRLDDLYSIGEMPSETETEKMARRGNISQIVEPFENTDEARQFGIAFPSLRQKIAEQYIRSLPSVPGELRLWWEHAGTGAYPGDWDRTMRELKENGFNAVIPNMLWGGLAHYDSKLLPHSRTFEQYGDQIEQAVRAGKKHGVEVHVWKVNYNARNAPKEFVDSMRQAGRTQVRFNGAQDDWLCPSHPENRKLECDTMVEVATNYDVDGIHFDYIRYPGGDYCYCHGCHERFEKHVGEAIADWPRATRSDQWREKFDDWRCDQITALVADVHREVKAVKPSVKISAAVFPKQPDSRGLVFQDWPLWVERGYLDFLCPMNYTSDAALFESHVESQVKIVSGRVPIYPGICATASDLGIALTTDQIATQMMVARKHGAQGFTIFNLSRHTIEQIPPVLRLGPTKP